MSGYHGRAEYGKCGGCHFMPQSCNTDHKRRCTHPRQHGLEVEDVRTCGCGLYVKRFHYSQPVVVGNPEVCLAWLAD